MAVACIARLTDAVEHHRLIESGEDLTTKFQWGVPFLQRELGPAAAGRAYVIAAPTGVGKSYYSMLIAASVDVPALYISLEDDVDEVGKRVEELSPNTLDRVLLATPTRSSLSIVEQTITQAHEDAGVRLVVVDYINRVHYDGDFRPFNEAAEIGLVFDELSGLAKELDFALVINAQVGRPREGNKTYGKRLFNIKGSSAIEEHAHTVIMLSELDNDTVEASIIKSKGRRKSGNVQHYRRTEPTGWLREMTREEVDADDGEELF